MNVSVGEIENGTTQPPHAHPTAGPPPCSGKHRYCFFVFRQNRGARKLASLKGDKDVKAMQGAQTQRFGFDTAAFIRKHDLSETGCVAIFESSA